MSAVYHARLLAGPRLRRPGDWLDAIRKRRLQRKAMRELAELPPYLLRDVGLVDLAPPPEHGGRTLDHNVIRAPLSGCYW